MHDFKFACTGILIQTYPICDMNLRDYEKMKIAFLIDIFTAFFVFNLLPLLERKLLKKNK